MDNGSTEKCHTTRTVRFVTVLNFEKDLILILQTRINNNYCKH